MNKVRRKGYSFISLILLFLIILIVFNFKNIVNSIQPDLSFGKIKVEEVLKIKKDNFENENSIFSVKNGLIQIKEDKMYYLNNEYVPIWMKDINGSDIEVYSSDNFIYVIDMKIGDIFKLDYQGNIIFNKYSQGDILKVIFSEDIQLVVLLSNHRVLKYDSELNIKKEENLNLEHILDIEFYNNKYYILNIENKNEMFFTRLVMLNENFEFISNLNINEEVLYDIFIKNNEKILKGNKKIVKINSKDEIIWETNFSYLIKNIVVNDKLYVNLIDEDLLQNAESYNFIKILNNDGVVVKEIQSPIQEINKMLIDNSKLYIINDNQLCVLNSELEIVFLKEVEENIINIKLIDHNKILVDTENNIIVYQMKI